MTRYFKIIAVAAIAFFAAEATADAQLLKNLLSDDAERSGELLAGTGGKTGE